MEGASQAELRFDDPGILFKKITGGVLRGPLARMTIGKSAARIDLTELDTR